MKYYSAQKRNEWSNHENPWRKVKCLCCVLESVSSVWLFAILWTPQALLFMGFSRQEYWSGLPCPLPGDLPDPGIDLCLLHLSPALTGDITTSATWETQPYVYIVQTGKVSVIFLLFPTVSRSFTLLGWPRGPVCRYFRRLRLLGADALHS